MKRKTTLDFDELNELDELRQVEKQVKKAKKSGTPIPIPYRDYFGKMYIEPEEMESRIDLAKQIENVMLYVFAYWLVASDAGLPKDEVRADAKEKLRSVIAKRTKIDSYLEKHINKLIDEVIDTTEKHTRKKEDEDEESDIEEFMREFDVANASPSSLVKELSGESENGYWTSRDRAMLISESEANAFENYVAYRDAKAQGKTRKVWLTELDDKVRMTHTLVEGKTVDIDGLFLVGDSLMRFPMDAEYDPDPSEVVNCRCVCKYE